MKIGISPEKFSVLMFRSLRFQLLFRSLLILSMLLILIGGLQYVFMKQELYIDNSRSIVSQIHSIPPEAWQESSHNEYGANGVKNNFFFPGVTIAFVNLSGKLSVLAQDLYAGAPPVYSKQFYQNISSGRVHDLHFKVATNKAGKEVLTVFDKVEQNGKVIGLAQMSTPTQPIKNILLRQMAIFSLLSITALLIGLLTFFPIIRHTLKPLSNIRRMMAHINAGNLNKRLPSYDKQVEINSLAMSFNGMLERIESSFNAEKEAKERMRRFVSDASHELRTPLTAIHGFLEILLRGAVNDPKKIEKSLKSMYEESKRMNKLVQDLLFLAKLDRVPGFNMKKDSLDSVLNEMEPQLRLLAEKRKAIFQIEPSVTAIFDRDKIKQVILNIYYNAIQHTDPKTGVIRVSLEKQGRNILLAIEDNGPGIPKKHLKHLFERFYRAESSRSRKYGGAGLGLSITKSIIENHNGTIEVKNKDGKGSIFLVRLPAEYKESPLK